MNAWQIVLQSLGSTLVDVLPIAAVLAFFQIAVLRRRVPELGRRLVGFGFVVLGLAVFLVGLEVALFPLGERMAIQLSDPDFVSADLSKSQMPSAPAADESTATAPPPALPWYRYHWVYLFAFSIGVTTTLAEPSLLAIAIKASEVSGGTIQPTGLRVAVALGVGFGVALGTFRIIAVHPLPAYILPGYLCVILQTLIAPKSIIPIAFDSGGVATSTVTVPIVAALGLGLATQIEGADPLIDGFGLIAFAVLFPIMTVMAYAQASQWRARRAERIPPPEHPNSDPLTLAGD